jgi:hypothetical protein
MWVPHFFVPHKITYKSGIKFYRRHAEDIRLYFKCMVNTFPDGSIHFLILKYASPALMFSVKIQSAFEKCLRFSFFMNDF